MGVDFAYPESPLDKRLIEILLELEYCKLTRQEAVSAIKQAIRDDGYIKLPKLAQDGTNIEPDYEVVDPKDVHVHVCSCGQIADTRFMTGSEWLEKFIFEYKHEVSYGEEYPHTKEVLAAARRATKI